MEIELIQQYLNEKVLILIPVLWVIGFFLKKSPKIPDWLIVWIILLIGVAASVFLITPDIHGAIQGVLAAGVATLGYDLVKQTKEGTK